MSASGWLLNLSMAAEHERLERKHECLQPEDQRVHQAEGINGMKRDRPEGACVFRNDGVVIVGICIRNAAAARRNAIDATLKERLEIDEQSAGFRHLLQFDQLFTAAELAPAM